MKDKEFKEKQSQMSNKELILLAYEEVIKLCKTGGKSIKMSVPPSIKDSDMLLCEVIRRLEDLTTNKEIEKEQQTYSKEELLAFGKSCFYKGFEKSEKDDANCFTAFREEIGILIEQFKKRDEIK